MKHLKNILTFTFSVGTVFLLSMGPNLAYSDSSTMVTPGRQGSIDGVATCHCPDDLGNCNCNGTRLQ